MYYDTLLKIRIDRETYQELKKIAKTKHTTISEIIRRLIYTELKKHRTNSIPRR